MPPPLRDVAIVAFAQAPVVACDLHRTAAEMLYPQIQAALAECGLERDAIDYQVAGSADYLDGRPFGFTDALNVMGSWPPRQDLHLEMDAAFAAYYAWIRLQAGACDTAMVVGFGKASEGDPRRILALQLDPYIQAPVGLEPVATAALQASAYMARTGRTDADLAALAAARRAAGARNPNAQLRTPAPAEDLRATPWAVEPLRWGYLPPVGESAACLILAAAEKVRDLPVRPVWIHGVDQRAEFQPLGARDLSRSASAALAAERALEMAGLESAAAADVAELAAATPVEEMILREALGLPPQGESPVAINPSGGPLTGHPLMVSGLIRLGEAFRQLQGAVGLHQVAGARRAIAHASQGHCLQHNCVWVLGAEPRGG